MIKSPDAYSLAVRLPNGKIKAKRVKQQSLTQKYRVLGLPFLRGIINLWEMLVIGIKALTWSANQQGEDEELGPWEWFITFALAILLTIGLFVILPYYGAGFLFTGNTIAFGALEGALRLVIFLLYLAVIGLSSDVKRMF